MRIALNIVILLIGMHQLHAQVYCEEDRFREVVFDSGEVTVEKDIIYGYALNWKDELKDLRLDIYMPLPEVDELPLRPLVIFIHGGGFSGGSKNIEEISMFGDSLSRMGYVVAAIDYRKGWENLNDCGGDTLSLEMARYRAIQDGRAAIRFLKAKSEDYGIDPDAIFIAGFSAGANIAIMAANAVQEDFSEFLYQELGSIDSSTNIFYNQDTRVKGLLLKAPGVRVTEPVTRYGIPALFIHGTCDRVIFYNQGPLYSCYTPVTYPIFYGSRYLSDFFLVNEVPYHFLTVEGGEHGDPADSLAIRTMIDFMIDALCGTLSNKEMYKFSPGGCLIETESQLDVEVNPNPVKDIISMTITSGFAGDYEVRIYNQLGQLLHFSLAEFEPPVRKFGIETASIPLERGIYFLEVRSRQYQGVFTFLKE